MNIAEALTAQARTQPFGTALIIPKRRTRDGWADQRYSYRELDELSSRLAAGLAQEGIRPGTRVAFMVPPSLEFFALFFALFKAGCVPVLIDPGIGLKPLKACLGEAEPEVFIGITKAQIARLVLGWARGSVKRTITVGPRVFWLGTRYKTLRGGELRGFVAPEVDPEDPAAILFTSGSTGIPKGVVYRHRHFAAQVELVRDSYRMQPGEVDLPTFPPFALFDPALGMTTVIPPMDFTRPASVDPAMLVSLIEHYAVTNLFGSPALMNTLTRHLEANGIRLPGLKRVLSAGAPVHPKVIERIHRALDEAADIHTPYGATECLPVATVSGRELTGELSEGNRQGRGICVGRPLDANQVRVIQISDDPIGLAEYAQDVAPGEIGEICVQGPTVTDQYFHREAQTRAAKMTDGQGRVWHRMGDLGWRDDQGRLWFCGRKSERVRTAEDELYTECVEGPVNAIDGVYRSALVGLGEPGQQTPVIVIEPEPGVDPSTLIEPVRTAVARWGIERVETRKAFPVDIRHNAKIRRAEIAADLS
ncbi:fatty acid CoA ligase family protein [Wenzhouxiangella marina]|uniref:AMP-ligase n=1 Tax=Wenzhouxiangella marina TaxID=1579979 RepID=A0A0K0XYS7_9GAMM|nr:fatty acid CoA ligase family protein [Wenzhouxiangella marina]AKS42777.1 AMP-ligase [Wenzhouxiangella marina]MBB6087545.1 acyl-CoA synthetase (AMP-forming)/AMP-acid ligase II [Wenzhouxiangella marina]